MSKTPETDRILKSSSTLALKHQLTIMTTHARKLELAAFEKELEQASKEGGGKRLFVREEGA